MRIGVHLGDVVEEADGDLMGDGVNVAARLESVAASGGFASPRMRGVKPSRNSARARTRRRPFRRTARSTPAPTL
jgi:class 3 adenylate cyclase